MRFLRRSIIGLFLLALTAGLLALSGATVFEAIEARLSDEPQERPARERVFAANVVPVVPETIRPTLSTFGEIRSRRTLEVRAAAAGRVVALHENFEEGGTVSKGELLVRLDPVDAETTLAVAETDLAEAEADLRDAERGLLLARDDVAAAEDQAQLRESALTRQRDLLDRGVGSVAAVETAELAVSSAAQAVLSKRQGLAGAEARVDQAQTTLERRRLAVEDARRRLAETEIRAAFDGVLTGAELVEGRLVNAGERLADLVDPDALEVVFRVSTPQYARLLTETGQLVGAEVTVAIDILGVDLEAQGQISRVGASVGEGQTGRQLFARIGEAPGFRPGDFVAVRIEEPELYGVSRLPASAIDAAGEVLVVGEDERLTVAKVELLRREGDDVIVRPGDVAGREIVAVRTPILGSGIRIRPLRPDGGETEGVQPEPDFVALDPERRARLVAFVEGNRFMPEEAKARVLSQLREEMVPVRVVERIESRMGG